MSTRHDHEWGFWSLALLGELGFLMPIIVVNASFVLYLLFGYSDAK